MSTGHITLQVSLQMSTSHITLQISLQMSTSHITLQISFDKHKLSIHIFLMTLGFTCLLM